MDFSKYISTPKNTPETSPLLTRLKLTKGCLTGGLLYFPSGPSGLLHFRAEVGGHQILPFNTGEDLRLDNCIFRVSLGIDLTEPPYTIDLITWNESEYYDHALTICFFLDPILVPSYNIVDLKKNIE